MTKEFKEVVAKTTFRDEIDMTEENFKKEVPWSKFTPITDSMSDAEVLQILLDRAIDYGREFGRWNG